MPLTPETRSDNAFQKRSKYGYVAWLKAPYDAFVKRRRNRNQPALTTRFGLWSALAVSTISVGFLGLGAWEFFEQQSYNLMHKVRRELAGVPHWDKRVVLIAMDETSVKRKGFSTWNRHQYADLLNVLAEGQPAAVVFDLSFAEPTPQDQEFAEAIARSRNVVLGVAQGKGITPTGIAQADTFLDVTPSISAIAEGAFKRGDLSSQQDSDGLTRQLPLQGANNHVPSLAVAALQVSEPAIADSRLPQKAPVWVSWPGETATAQMEAGPGTLPVYSYIDVLEGQVDPRLMQNKIVLVGVTTFASDPMRSPFWVDHSVSGVHFLAAAINNLLNKSYLRRPPAWQSALLLVSLALTTGYLLRRQGMYPRLLTMATFPLVWAALALGAFYAGWWLPVAAPIGTVLLGSLAVQLYEQQEKQQLMALLSMNVSAGTAELIWRHKGVLLDKGGLAAQTLTATVLFMDIRGFTSIAETLPSQQLLPWLNQYFETMTECIMKHGGMVDKYIGDAIMAVFGAPLPRHSPEEIQADAIAALHAALEMHQRLKRLNAQLAQQNLPTIEFGIGIHTGPLIGGTVGNRQRFNYSLFGDAVNIAARLETMTKALPADAPFNILLSASTRQYTHAYFPMQSFQSCQLQGRTGLTDTYTIATPVPSPVPSNQSQGDRPMPAQQPLLNKAHRANPSNSSNGTNGRLRPRLIPLPWR
ncbi:MAG: adenylate/guanylate cyclase domain-containing protein [Cyanobacteria bacterium P01_D01_bin.105]